MLEVEQREVASGGFMNVADAWRGEFDDEMPELRRTRLGHGFEIVRHRIFSLDPPGASPVRVSGFDIASLFPRQKGENGAEGSPAFYRVRPFTKIAVTKWSHGARNPPSDRNSRARTRN